MPFVLRPAAACAACLLCHLAPAQTADTARATLEVSGYADGYFAVYTGQLGPRELQPYATASPRDNTLGVNIAQVGLHYASDRVRSEVILHCGDIAVATWDQRFRPIQTAYAGLRLRENLWFDVGFFATHIGAEGFLPKDNLLSQTAVLTYNEPFYQAGARLVYTPSASWEIQLWGLNGYNLFIDDNDAKSLGINVTYGASEAWEVGYGNVFGREGADDEPAQPFRAYQYGYAEYERGRWHSLTSVDHGLQTRGRNGGEDASQLLAGQSTLRYRIGRGYSLTTRAEFYDDPRGFISGTFPRMGQAVPEGLRWVALTLGAEWSPERGSYLRIEGRYGRVQDGLTVFLDDGAPDPTRIAGMLTIGHSFRQTLVGRVGTD